MTIQDIQNVVTGWCNLVGAMEGAGALAHDEAMYLLFTEIPPVDVVDLMDAVEEEKL